MKLLKNINKLKLKIINSVNGFTLIELLVVIGVMGVLASATVVLVDPLAQLQKARDAERKSDLRQIQSALEIYRADNGSYPLVVTSGDGYQSNGAAGECDNGGIVHGTTTYMNKILCDPQIAMGEYFYQSAGASYSLTACLERSTDPDISGTCTRGGYRYVVTNP